MAAQPRRSPRTLQPIDGDLDLENLRRRVFASTPRRGCCGAVMAKCKGTRPPCSLRWDPRLPRIRYARTHTVKSLYAAYKHLFGLKGTARPEVDQRWIAACLRASVGRIEARP